MTYNPHLHSQVIKAGSVAVAAVGTHEKNSLFILIKCRKTITTAVQLALELLNPPRPYPLLS